MPTDDDRAVRASAYGDFLIGLVRSEPDHLDSLLARFGANPELVAQARADVLAEFAAAGDEVQR